MSEEMNKSLYTSKEIVSNINNVAIQVNENTNKTTKEVKQRLFGQDLTQENYYKSLICLFVSLVSFVSLLLYLIFKN